MLRHFAADILHLGSVDCTFHFGSLGPDVRSLGLTYLVGYRYLDICRRGYIILLGLDRMGLDWDKALTT